MKSILIIDNNDSFTANLEHLLAVKSSVRPEITAYDDIASVRPDRWDMLVISPGPGKPEDYPDYTAILQSPKPILGICLGMQIINRFCGGETGRLDRCIHGKTDTITFDGRAFEVARYHSLYLCRVADSLDIIATNTGGIPMAVRHRTRKMLGYQFHPESFLTQQGEYFIDYALSFFYGNNAR